MIEHIEMLYFFFTSWKMKHILDLIIFEFFVNLVYYQKWKFFFLDISKQLVFDRESISYGP